MSNTKSPLGSENNVPNRDERTSLSGPGSNIPLPGGFSGSLASDVSRHTGPVYPSATRSVIGRVQEQGPDFYEMAQDILSPSIIPGMQRPEDPDFSKMAEDILETAGLQHRIAYLNHRGGNSL
jgi:hypothetical protein